jgi:hypothetical protein
METYVITTLNASLGLTPEHRNTVASTEKVHLDELPTVHGEIEKMLGDVTR